MISIKSMKIIVRTIPHSEQRYDTCGDWWWLGETLCVFISDLGNPMWEYLVASHEIDEAMLCRENNVSEEKITAFDKDYESSRRAGIPARCKCRPTKTSEPGDDKHAPYGKYHRIATIFEKQRAKKLKVNWRLYERKINSLIWKI